jgi:hypothetical protein
MVADMRRPLLLALWLLDNYFKFCLLTTFDSLKCSMKLVTSMSWVEGPICGVLNSHNFWLQSTVGQLLAKNSFLLVFCVFDQNRRPWQLPRQCDVSTCSMRHPVASSEARDVILTIYINPSQITLALPNSPTLPLQCRIADVGPRLMWWPSPSVFSALPPAGTPASGCVGGT